MNKYNFYQDAAINWLNQYTDICRTNSENSVNTFNYVAGYCFICWGLVTGFLHVALHSKTDHLKPSPVSQEAMNSESQHFLGFQGLMPTQLLSSGPWPPFPLVYDVIWYGISLWSFWVCCPASASSQFFAFPHPTCCWGGVRTWEVPNLV